MFIVFEFLLGRRRAVWHEGSSFVPYFHASLARALARASSSHTNNSEVSCLQTVRPPKRFYISPPWGVLRRFRCVISGFSLKCASSIVQLYSSSCYRDRHELG